MKRLLIKYTFFIGLSVILASACNKDLLDTVPNDRLSTNIFWKTEQDAVLAVNAIYTFLDGNTIFSWDAYTDIAHVNQNFQPEAFVELGTYDVTSAPVYNAWAAAYQGIQLSNYFLANVDKVNTTNTALIDRLKSEARTIRAYHYIKLAGLFGDVPLITTPLNVDEAVKLTRTPVAQIYDFVDKELTESAPLLPASYPSAADRGRIRQGTAWALKARADLWAGRYQAAVDAASQVTGYSLNKSYQNLFTYAGENNSEILLDKQFIKDLVPVNVFNLLAPYSQKNAQGYYVPTRAMVDMYEDNDPRMHFSIFMNGDTLPSGIVFKPTPGGGGADAIGSTYYSSATGYNIKKYINNADYADPSNNGINIILLRYAEVLLTYAEAKIELNQLDASVYDAINKVRNSRDDVKLPDIAMGKTQAELRAIVRRERTVELAFEGLHLFDIRRWKTGATVMQGPVYGMTYISNGQPVTVEAVSSTRTFTDKHYLWPIPQKERDLDPNLSQNKDW
ncbi:RagB/SusD family nutrient uptake outer membrane protein [Chitinophaga agrisoli]|uniref:RagB/SusD family nutrient uptake outer membrane protein n=1 Tax=Chitinophaga agrisoli TaxID=2607653 RepID=A0A5B2VPC5_9BACT|nr:RagB/SusD family nutrient uptake outer membrane protein [Chitinophaga agrisoli]KAA2240047.1 RagB/SusD family nutrient uptake outer membrane protein [Chitinophaga agrisoli]